MKKRNRSNEGVWFLIGVIVCLFGIESASGQAVRTSVRKSKSGKAKPKLMSTKNLAAKKSIEQRARDEVKIHRIIEQYLNPEENGPIVDPSDENDAAAKAAIKELSDSGKREAAIEKLVNIGKESLPALYKAKKSDNAEVVKHVATMIETINKNLANGIDKLIVDMGSNSYKVREAATKKASKIGVFAMDALVKAAESKDAEIATRATEALLNINHGLTMVATSALIKYKFTAEDVLEDLHDIAIKKCRDFNRKRADLRVKGKQEQRDRFDRDYDKLAIERDKLNALLSCFTNALSKQHPKPKSKSKYNKKSGTVFIDRKGKIIKLKR